MTNTRSYQSPLREQQREQTRRRILDAAIGLLADDGELSVPDVAKRAGVATRTVYFHFESKPALLDALSKLLDEEIGVVAFPETADELPAYSDSFWEGFLENEQLWRALSLSRTGSDVRKRGRSRRFDSFQRSVESHAAGLDPREKVLAAAVLYSYFSPELRLALLDKFGLDADQAGRGVTWAIRTLLAELERNPSGPIA